MSQKLLINLRLINHVNRWTWCLTFAKTFCRCGGLLMFQMKDLQHYNICTFIGACFEASEIILVSEFCSRGNLRVEFHDLCLSTIISNFVHARIHCLHSRVTQKIVFTSTFVKVCLIVDLAHCMYLSR